jgi:hypothetical protein
MADTELSGILRAAQATWLWPCRLGEGVVRRYRWLEPRVWCEYEQAACVMDLGGSGGLEAASETGEPTVWCTYFFAGFNNDRTIHVYVDDSDSLLG